MQILLSGELVGPMEEEIVATNLDEKKMPIRNYGRIIRVRCCVPFFLLLCAGCVTSNAADESVSIQGDSRNIYRSFLVKWIADEGSPIKISRIAVPFAAGEPSKYSQCASPLGYGGGGSGARWVSTES